MKTRLLALLLVLMMVVSMLASCDLLGIGGTGDGEGEGEGNQTCTNHVDKNPADGACDVCGADVSKKPTGDNVGDNGEELPAVTWKATADLLFQMTDNSNGDELSSGCKRFLSGESDDTGFVAQNAKDRNTDAYNYANVNVTYLYYENTSGFGWGSCITKMNLAATSDTEKGRPDMFTNFVYDMVSASLLGSFNNLYTDAVTSEGVKTGEKTNYFQFAKNGKYDTKYKDTGDGYMVEYMQSLTLSENKMYLVASDYFTDLVRAFFAVPVNIGLLESAIKPSSDANAYNYDADGDGAYEISDFYSLVTAGKWNYDNVKAFSAAVYQAPTDSADVLKDGRYGFALAAGGLGASGILYTTSVIVIERKVVEKEDLSDPTNPVTYQDYTFWYPEESAPLEGFVENLNSLFSSTGVVAINKSADHSGPINTTSQSSAEVVVRNAFAEGKVLFGGIVCVGSLEDTIYGGMLENGEGFGVVPGPLYRTNYTDDKGATQVDKYLTQIHNIGKVGAIGIKTKYFAQCSAFLNYQSLNSADILDDYYNFTLKTDAVADEGGAEMLDYIRENVRSSFDKAFEDAIARQAQMSGNKDLNQHKWHNMILDKCFNLTRDEMHSQYATWMDAKAAALEALELSYAGLPA